MQDSLDQCPMLINTNPSCIIEPNPNVVTKTKYQPTAPLKILSFVTRVSNVAL